MENESLNCCNNNNTVQEHPAPPTSNMNDTDMIMNPPIRHSYESNTMNVDDVFIASTDISPAPTTTTTTSPAQAVLPEEVTMHDSTTATTTTTTTTAAAVPNISTSAPTFLSSSSTTATTTSTTTRYDTFTEAVPLSLSSMAHLNIPLTDGVVDGIIQVIHHTLIQCVNYITRLHMTNNSNTSSSDTTNNPVSFFNDIATTPYAWIPIKDDNPKNISPQQHLPHVLQRMNFIHLYSRNAFIYYKPKLPNPNTYTKEMEVDLWKQMNWNSNTSGSSNNDWYVADPTGTGSHYSNGILGRIRLFYCSPEPLTPGELNGTDTDDDDMPPCILYQMMVEYCSPAPTGNIHAVQAEELSMLSFGSGSIDDDIKYGALASLYDELAKYVLEIYSVRGKKYKFDLMDSTLANGTVPHIPTLRSTNGVPNSNKTDPFLKNLCVTVTDHQHHHLPLSSKEQDGTTPETKDMMTDDNNNDDMNNTIPTKRGTAVTRIYLTLEGKLRTNGSRSSASNMTKDSNTITTTTSSSSTTTALTATTTNAVNSAGPQLQDVPAFDYLKNVISYAFLRLNPNPSDMVQAHPSGHTLLLDPDVAGHIYINGRYAMTWGDDNGISASHGTALFGIDLHSIPFWNGRIVDYELVKETYAQLWYEILIDAKLQHLNIASKLLHRLIKGVDPISTTILEEDNDLYDDTDDDENMTSPDVHQDCLESLILAAPNYDRVGIAAKALATRFAIEFGKMAFPCLAHETEWVKRTLPDREPIVVPQRLINILRRGGYFDVQKTVDLLWFTDSRPIQEEYEMEIINIAVQYLEVAGCNDVDAENIVLISSPVADNVIAKDVVCRWDSTSEQFYVHEEFFKSSINDLIGNGVEETSNTTPQQIKGYLLGMYIAKAHPVGYGKVLARYLVRNKL